MKRANDLVIEMFAAPGEEISKCLTWNHLSKLFYYISSSKDARISARRFSVGNLEAAFILRGSPNPYAKVSFDLTTDAEDFSRT